ncbi:MAG: NUDIX domain-containing protein [Candidatus Saccharimonadales bacterium]
MKKHSAGILVYKINQDGQLIVLLAHPGGPYFANKDNAAWTIPKGEYETSEEPLIAARREFQEEIGQTVPNGELISLGEFTRQDGKNIKAWAVPGKIDITTVCSNKFEMEWPPKSGNQQAFPEIDRAEWFPAQVALNKLSSGQSIFVFRLADYLQIDLPQLP